MRRKWGRQLLTNSALLTSSLYLTCLVIDVAFRARPLATLTQIRRAAARQAAARAGIRRDSLTMVDFARELRHNGDSSAVPAMTAGLAALAAPITGVHTLGGVARSTSVLCKENGPWLSYRSDEHGFRNPPDAWRAPLQVLVLGDSFAQGVCQPEDSTFVAVLRHHWPATLSLGISGNGPLAVLAGIREYVPYLSPVVVVWLYFGGNDLEDLEIEKKTRLRRYLENEYSQGLLSRQAEVDALLRSWISRTLLAPRRPAPSPEHGPALTAHLKLRHLRQSVAAMMERRRGTACCDMALMERIAAQADREVHASGGRLMFAYLPSPPQNAYAAHGTAQGAEIRRRITQLGIPVLDLTPDLLPDSAPQRYFRYFDSHLDAAGNALMGHRLAEAITIGRYFAQD